jgi:hypothetical protein
VVSHIAPFLALACRNKDIIDVLHDTQDKFELLKSGLEPQRLQQPVTWTTRQLSVGLSTSELSMNKINTKVIPDTSANQYGKKDSVCVELQFVMPFCLHLS